MAILEIHDEQLDAYLAEVSKRLEGLKTKRKKISDRLFNQIKEKENIDLAISQSELKLSNMDHEIDKMQFALDNPKK